MDPRPSRGDGERWFPTRAEVVALLSAIAPAVRLIIAYFRLRKQP